MNTTIDIAADDLATVWQILNKHLKPSIIKWAFGSRAKWSAKTHSDLDLALQDPYGKTIPFDTIANLQADFEDSDLPWKVDIIDLNDIDEDFRIKITYTAVKLPSFGDEEFITLQYAVESANTGLDAIKRAPIVEHNTGIKCLRIQDISQSKPFFSWGYTEVTANNFQKFQLIKDDILIARTGASIGVNKYIEPDEGEPQIELHPYDSETEVRQITNLSRTRAQRDEEKVRALLAELTTQAEDESKNLLPITIKLVKARASMGEIVGTLKSLWGTYRENPVI